MDDFLFATDGSVDQGETDNQLIWFDMHEIDLDVPAKTKQASFYAVTSSIFLC